MGCDFLGCLLFFVFSIEREEMEVDCFVERWMEGWRWVVLF